MKKITSRQNPEVVFAASLQTKKGRNETGLFPAEGEKLFLEASKPENRHLIDRIYLSEGDSPRYLPLIRDSLGTSFLDSDRVTILPSTVFEKISSEKSPQGMITILKTLDISKNYIKINKKDIFRSPTDRILALTSVRDPGNLGAIIRSAVAFGFQTLVLTEDCAELTNPKTVRAAMGGLFRLRFLCVSDFSSFITEVHSSGRRVLAAELRDGAIPIEKIGLRSDDVVMIGNEGHGIPTEYSKLADHSVYIPISEQSESLNAAVAASLFLWEISKAGN